MTFLTSQLQRIGLVKEVALRRRLWGDQDDGLPSVRGKPLLSLSAFVAVAGLWLLTHMYEGVLLDARIYVGRALADLAPTTIGRDLMFIHDGQAPYSLFTYLARFLVAGFGVRTASLILAVAGTIAWFSAVTALAHRLARGRLPWVMLAGLAVLPNTYGGFNIIPFGEALAVPRPFAEAGVLAAFCAYLDGRSWLSFAFLLAAGLFHPIMAVGGVGALVLVLMARDKRWILAAAAVAALIAVAGALDLPLANRLFKPVDPRWLDLLKRRNAYLFPGLWTLPTWAQAAVQATTTLIAAALMQGRARSLFIAALTTAVAGVGLAWLSGDVFPNLLLLQVQPWRALWVIAVLGAISAPLCAARLWRRGAGARVVLAALAAAWLFSDSVVALLASLLALGVFAWDSWGGGAPISRLGAKAAWASVTLLAAVRFSQSLKEWLAISQSLPPGVPWDQIVRLCHFEITLVGPLVVWAAVTRSQPLLNAAARLLPLAAALLLGAGILGWYRPPGHADPGLASEQRLARILSAQSGPVEWIDGDVQSWTIARRANWATELQGASIVFSQEQALSWQDRMQRLLALHLTSPDVLKTFERPTTISSVRPGALTALCDTKDGPSWIISHVLDGQAPPRAAHTQIWRLEKPIVLYDGEMHWFNVSTFAVTRCDRAAAPSGLVVQDHPSGAKT